MESFGTKVRAYVYALLVHLACFAVMFIGLLWTQTVRPVSVPGAVIEAELIGPASAPTPRAAAKPRPAPPKPVPVQPAPEPPKAPEPKPQDAPNEPQHNDAVDQEKISALALQKAEQAQRAEEEKKRREQVLLENQQRERLQQLEDIKRQREAAEKARKLEQQKLAQLDDLKRQQQKPERPAPPQTPEAEQRKTGTNGLTNSLADQYGAAIINVVKQNWNRPDNAQPGLRCAIRVIQIPGGDVINTTIAAPCNADLATQNSIVQAVTKAQPLPYKGYESVFQRDITFIFTYDGN